MKNIFKKAGKGLLAFSILANTFMPLGSVFADGTYDISFEVENAEVFSMAKEGTDQIRVTITGKEGNSFIVPNVSDSGSATSSCDDSSHCKISIPNSKTVSFNFVTGDMDLTNETDKTGKISPDTVIDKAITLSVKVPSGDEPGPQFDGHAVVIWSCGTGTCYHRFENIEPNPDGITQYIKASTVEANNDTSKKFDVKAQYKGWALETKFDAWIEAYKAINKVDSVAWEQVDTSTLVGDPPDMREWEDKAEKAGACTKEGKAREEFEACVDQYYIAAGNLPFIKLQPVGEPNEKNAYVSYGDRNFKIAIYNDDFKGLKLGTLNELEYYPAQWADPMLRREGFDISETTKEKPAKMDSILLESTYRFKELDANGFKIDSVEPLDVPEGAVEVKKEGTEYVIYFHSNFYDNVVFKITDTDENEYYIQVKRYTVDAWFRNLENESYIYADFYFDKELSYTNFDLTAKIVYKDGTVKNVVLSPYGKVDDGLNNWSDEPEVDVSVQHDPYIPAGKGLKQSAFVYKLSKDEDKKISKIYLNAEYKGSTAEKYAGAYVGSGLGTLANIYTGEEE